MIELTDRSGRQVRSLPRCLWKCTHIPHLAAPLEAHEQDSAVGRPVRVAQHPETWRQARPVYVGDLGIGLGLRNTATFKKVSLRCATSTRCNAARWYLFFDVDDLLDRIPIIYTRKMQVRNKRSNGTSSYPRVHTNSLTAASCQNAVSIRIRMCITTSPWNPVSTLL